MPARPSSSRAPDVSIGEKPDGNRALMLQAYDSVVPQRGAIYCSAPLTSGRRYIEWLTRPGGTRHLIDNLSDVERDLHRQQVIEPNRAHAKQAADRLRQRTQRPVIDPTAVGPIDGWRQANWIGFWEEVIARFAFEVVLIDGWEYSYGCTHEFWFAQSKGIPTLDEAGQPLSASQGTPRIHAAVADLRRAGADTSKLDRVIELLRGLGS